MVNPAWLRTFITLTEQGHFTRTADLLAMTQPGVSQHIKKLESHYQTSLINRQGKHFELTPSGEMVYRFALKILEGEENLRETLNKDDPHSGLCRLSSPGALGLALYPKLINAQKKYPGLKIFFEIAPNHRIESELLNNHLDCGYMSQKPESSSLEAESVMTEQVCLVVPANFQLQEYEQLQTLGMIHHPDAEHHASLLLQENFPDAFRGISDFPAQGYINQINLILEPVAAGLGFTVLPESAVRSYAFPERIKVVTLPQPAYETIYRVFKKHRLLPSRFQFIQETLFSNPVSMQKTDKQFYQTSSP
ncbi:LysR family transcriptional regulator [Endozoicomonas sp. 8E]|uniref:LysR family transcriptional regulator n=1 Tax=Endozoicomonas sp. 8E TaxID=3035692 RepID=UPI0029394935|nr:LysR family transcriptional regulator [Endozoicomonas sp. 8E]WOG28717.1 LysR family transcriptional regulator [Endozoicomonas sp. 8E]